MGKSAAEGPMSAYPDVEKLADQVTSGQGSRPGAPDQGITGGEMSIPNTPENKRLLEQAIDAVRGVDRWACQGIRDDCAGCAECMPGKDGEDATVYVKIRLSFALLIMLMWMLLWLWIGINVGFQMGVLYE